MSNEQNEPNEVSPSSSSEGFKLFEKTLTKQYDLHLSESVEAEGLVYCDIIHTLNDKVNEGDVVNVYLTSFGGAAHSCFKLGHAMKNCKGVVIVHLPAPCYSAGAILALCGDALIMYPGSMLMFHNYSTIEIGKGRELAGAVSEYQRYFHRTLTYFCHPFLTKKEIRKLVNDQDVYVHDDDHPDVNGQPDVKERLKRQFPRMENK